MRTFFSSWAEAGSHAIKIQSAEAKNWILFMGAESIDFDVGLRTREIWDENRNRPDNGGVDSVNNRARS
jgi:hypothetical protein